MNTHDQKSKAGSRPSGATNSTPDGAKLPPDNVIDIRSHLKVVLIDLDAAREKRRAGYAASISRSDMRVIEKHLTLTTSRFDALMHKLIMHP